MIFSILAFLVVCISVCIKDRKKSLCVQSLNCFFEAIYDFTINAFTGAVLSIINLIRTLIYIQKNKISKTLYVIILVVFESVIVANCFYTWSGYISLLPTIGSMIRSYCLWQSNMKLVRISGITTGILYGLYYIYYKSWFLVLGFTILLITSIIAVVKNDLTNKKGDQYEIYVIRHGETDWNLKGKIQGNTDVKLNKNGIEQAKKLKKILETYNIDIIISSPLKRARRTAEIINETIKCNIIFDENLRERGYGEFEGRTIEDLEEDEVIKSGILHDYFINKQYKGVEPIKDIFNRVKQTVDKLKSEYKDKNILLVTHGATIAVIEACLNGIGEDGKIDKSNTKNCEIKTYNC